MFTNYVFICNAFFLEVGGCLCCFQTGSSGWWFLRWDCFFLAGRSWDPWFGVCGLGCLGWNHVVGCLGFRLLRVAVRTASGTAPAQCRGGRAPRTGARVRRHRIALVFQSYLTAPLNCDAQQRSETLVVKRVLLKLPRVPSICDHQAFKYTQSNNIIMWKTSFFFHTQLSIFFFWPFQSSEQGCFLKDRIVMITWDTCDACALP